MLGYLTADADPGPGTQNVLVPSLIGSALFEQERIRTGANIAMQLRPSERLEFNLTCLYSEFSADNINQNFMAWALRALGNGGTLNECEHCRRHRGCRHHRIAQQRHGRLRRRLRRDRSRGNGGDA